MQIVVRVLIMALRIISFRELFSEINSPDFKERSEGSLLEGEE
jgi:hypothetical protein